MGLLIDGAWHEQVPNAAKTDGRFLRPQSAFRNWVTPDGRPGPSGSDGFSAQSGRYHLYVSWACPWWRVFALPRRARWRRLRARRFA